MTFTISLEHTKNKKWQHEREQQWENICRQSFPTDSTEEELKPYRDYFFLGDIDVAIETGAYTDFGTILFWSPSNNIGDLKKLFIYYWQWFFTDDVNVKIYQGYGFETPKEYLNSILLNIASWTYYQPPELMAELFLWVFGEQYDENRVFPIPLGNSNWQPKISISKHSLAFFLLRGIRGYLFTYDNDSIYPKYAYLIEFFLSVFHNIDTRIYSTKRIDRNTELPFDKSDQRIVRWFIANIEGVITNKEVDKNNGEIPHNNIEKETLLRDGLSKLELSDEYHQLVIFVHKHGNDCLNHFDDD